MQRIFNVSRFHTYVPATGSPEENQSMLNERTPSEGAMWLVEVGRDERLGCFYYKRMNE